MIDDVKEFRSEIGVLYLSEFNRKVLTKAFSMPSNGNGIYLSAKGIIIQLL